MGQQMRAVMTRRQRSKTVWRSAHAGPEARHGRVVRARGGAKAVPLRLGMSGPKGGCQRGITCSITALGVQRCKLHVAARSNALGSRPDWFQLVACLLTSRGVAERLRGAFVVHVWKHCERRC